MSEIFTANHMQEFFLFLGATVPTATARCVAGLPVFRHAETVTVGGAAPGKWVGEPFAVDSHSYYRVKLISRATAHAMVGFTYSDALGQLVVADNYDRISAAADWTTTVIYLRPPPTAVAARMTVVTVAEHPCDVQAIRVDRVTEKKAGDWIATVLRKLPPLVPEVDDDGVLARLPQTHRLLAAGRSLRTVFLGDSIVNDICNGLPGLQLKRLWQRWLDVAGYPSAVFMRDSSHANRVGKLVLAALVADQFRDREHPGESPC